MKTSFSEILKTEKYLNQELGTGDSLVFEARLLVDVELRKNTIFHKAVHRLVHLYHRRKLKNELQMVHERLFSDPEKTTFREGILKPFNL